MRRSLAFPFIVAVSVLLTPYALLAQRGGHAGGSSGGSFSGASGFGSGGFARGFSSSSTSFSSGQRSFSGHSSSYPHFYPRSGLSSPRPSYSSRSSGGSGRGFTPSRWRRNDYRWSYAYSAFPYASGGVVYWPYFGDSGDSSYGANNDADNGANSNLNEQPAQQAGAEEADGGPRPSYEPQQAPESYSVRPTYNSEAPAVTQPAVTIIYKDGRSQQIHNYALTRATLLLLDDASSGRESDVPLDQIDLAATERANRQAGVNFSLPTPQ